MNRVRSAQPDLFNPAPTHDPGGSIKSALPRDIDGSGPGEPFHGPNLCYRTTLWRRWGESRQHQHGEYPFALLIGMNPSTADPHHNDPTLTRDIGFVKAWGLCAFCKTNVGDYRASFPHELTKITISPVSEQNFPTILQLARSPHCDRVVLGFGVVPKPLKHKADELVFLLRQDGHRLWSLGKTLLGSPRHPLYLSAGTPLEQF